jgi:hypothetical protein
VHRHLAHLAAQSHDLDTFVEHHHAIIDGGPRTDEAIWSQVALGILQLWLGDGTSASRWFDAALDRARDSQTSIGSLVDRIVDECRKTGQSETGLRYVAALADHHRRQGMPADEARVWMTYGQACQPSAVEAKRG